MDIRGHAWSRSYFSGTLTPDQVRAKAVKQKLRKLHPKTVLQVKEEVDKLHKVKFIKVFLYPQWVANIVPVIKKNGQV